MDWFEILSENLQMPTANRTLLLKHLTEDKGQKFSHITGKRQFTQRFTTS